MNQVKGDAIDIFFELLNEEFPGGDFATKFRIYCGTQRLGQAFFNSLPTVYQSQLRAGSWDPFYSNSWGAIYNAIDYLTKG